MDGEAREDGFRGELLGLEPLFHRLPSGSGREDVEGLVAPGFWQVGASGSVYSREFIIDTVARRYAEGIDPDDAAWHISEFRAVELVGGARLATYLLDFRGWRSRRSTLWQRDERGWRAAYHQGTLVEVE